MPDKKMTRKERRAAARKKQILEAAMQVFLEKGFLGATTKEIADAADIAEGTIYNYFQSKEDLLLEMITMMAALGDRQAFFDESLRMGFREFLTTFYIQKQSGSGGRYDLLTAILPALLSNSEIRERYNQEVVQPGIEMFVEHFQKRIDLDQLYPIDDLALVVRLLTGASFGVWLLLLLGDPVILEAMRKPEAFTDLAIRILYDQFIPGHGHPPITKHPRRESDEGEG